MARFPVFSRGKSSARANGQSKLDHFAFTLHGDVELTSGKGHRYLTLVY
jgi:hypothetical protein